jgi:hypothetical protein
MYEINLEFIFSTHSIILTNRSICACVSASGMLIRIFCYCALNGSNKIMNIPYCFLCVFDDSSISLMVKEFFCRVKCCMCEG